MDTINEKKRCGWCGHELSEDNCVVLNEELEDGKRTYLCDSCASTIFITNDADMC